MWYSGAGHRWQYGACALHAGYLRLQTHTHNMQDIILFHGNKGYANAPQCHVIRTVPVLLYLRPRTLSVAAGSNQVSKHPDRCSWESEGHFGRWNEETVLCVWGESDTIICIERSRAVTNFTAQKARFKSLRFALEQTTKVLRRSRCIALPFL